MALMKCPECGKDVSTSAVSCPHCGYPIGKYIANIHAGHERMVYSGMAAPDSGHMDAAEVAVAEPCPADNSDAKAIANEDGDVAGNVESTATTAGSAKHNGNEPDIKKAEPDSESKKKGRTFDKTNIVRQNPDSILFVRKETAFLGEYKGGEALYIYEKARVLVFVILLGDRVVSVKEFVKFSDIIGCKIYENERLTASLGAGIVGGIIGGGVGAVVAGKNASKNIKVTGEILTRNISNPSIPLKFMEEECRRNSTEAEEATEQSKAVYATMQAILAQNEARKAAGVMQDDSDRYGAWVGETLECLEAGNVANSESVAHSIDEEEKPIWAGEPGKYDKRNRDMLEKAGTEEQVNQKVENVKTKKEKKQYKVYYIVAALLAFAFFAGIIKSVRDSTANQQRQNEKGTIEAVDAETWHSIQEGYSDAIVTYTLFSEIKDQIKSGAMVGKDWEQKYESWMYYVEEHEANAKNIMGSTEVKTDVNNAAICLNNIDAYLHDALVYCKNGSYEKCEQSLNGYQEYADKMKLYLPEEYLLASTTQVQQDLTLSRATESVSDSRGSLTDGEAADEDMNNCPLKIIQSYVSSDSIGNPRVAITCQNSSQKTIDAFTVDIFCYDNFNRPVNHYLYNTNLFKGIAQDTIIPDGYYDGETNYWQLYGYDNTTKFYAFISEIHFTDGTEWAVHENFEEKAREYADRVIKNISFD